MAPQLEEQTPTMVSGPITTHPPTRSTIQRQRRPAVSAPAVTQERLENWTPCSYPKTERERSAIYDAIDQQRLLFGHLSPSGRARVVDAMFKVTIPSGEFVIKQGSDADNFYTVQTGKFQFLVTREGETEARVVGIAGPGATFGELALLYGSPRAASVLALEDSVLWALDRDTFQLMLTTAENTKKRTYEDFLENVNILKGLNKYERVQLSDMLVKSKYRPGECIVRQGERGDRFFIVEKGEALAVVEDEKYPAELVVYRYGSGGYFGELALLGRGIRKASVFATTRCSVLSIDKATFDRVLGPVRGIFSDNLKTYRAAVDQKQAELEERRKALETPRY